MAGKDIRKMRLVMKKVKAALLVMMILGSVILPAMHVQAATGKTTIAVSASEIKVGENVSITVKAKTSAGNTAKAKLKLTYDDDVLEFVSCSATYDGGAGGSVTATASSMTVKFKAVAEGRCPLYVEASNGVDSGSGSSLSSVEGCSTNITVKAGSGSQSNSGNLSKDNSLKKLSLSAGTLSPQFAGNVVNYTATVAGDVTDVQVNAETSNANASIESISGNTDLQVGTNTIKIVVEAENGALATYTIELTREEMQEEVPATEQENVTTEVVEDTASKKELEEALERNEFLSNSYKQLEEKYQREKDFSRSVIYVLIIVIAILVVLLINMIVLLFRKVDNDFDDDFDMKKTPKKSETKPVAKPTVKPEEKADIRPVAKPEVKPMVKSEEKPVTKIEPKPTVKPVAKPAVKPMEKPAVKPAPKPAASNKFEVLDFNDED